MEQTKPWYQSFTVWFTVVQGILGVLIGAGVLPDMGGASGATVAGGGVAGLSVGSLIARARASKKLTK